MRERNVKDLLFAEGATGEVNLKLSLRRVYRAYPLRRWLAVFSLCPLEHVLTRGLLILGTAQVLELLDEMLIILNLIVCRAKPRLKMMWCVPVTQMVPSGLRMRHASFSHLTLNR